MVDIILSKRRNINSNRIGFVKTSLESVALNILDKLIGIEFLGVKMDLKLPKSKLRGNKENEVFCNSQEKGIGGVEDKLASKQEFKAEKIDKEKGVDLPLNNFNFFEKVYACFSNFFN